MGIIQERIQQIKEIENKINNHCLCFNFEEHPGYYYITLPEGYNIGAIRAWKDQPKTKVLKRIYEILEKTWKNSFIN